MGGGGAGTGTDGLMARSSRPLCPGVPHSTAACHVPAGGALFAAWPPRAQANPARGTEAQDCGVGQRSLPSPGLAWPEHTSAVTTNYSEQAKGASHCFTGTYVRDRNKFGGSGQERSPRLVVTNFRCQCQHTRIYIGTSARKEMR